MSFMVNAFSLFRCLLEYSFFPTVIAIAVCFLDEVEENIDNVIAIDLAHDNPQYELPHVVCPVELPLQHR